MLLIDGYQGAVNGYVDYYGMTFPVLNDETQEASQALGVGYEIPYYILLGRDMTVLATGGSPAPSNILQEALAEPWPDVDRPLQPDELAPDDLDDGTASLPEGASPFAAEAVTVWEQGNACSLAPASTPSPAAALLLVPLAAVALRRR